MDKKPSIDALRRPLLLITYAVALYFLFARFGLVISGLKFILSILFPFLIGAFLAFLFNLVMTPLEHKLFYRRGPARRRRYSRPVSILLTLLLLAAILITVLLLIVPALNDTLLRIGSTVPAFFKQMEAWLVELGIDEAYLEENVFSRLPDLNDIWGKVLGAVQTFSTGVLTSTIGFVSSAVSLFTQVGVALVFAIYLLASKENLLRQCKMAMYAHLPERFCDRALEICRLTSRTFGSFFSGQVVEACILGLMFFVSMTVLQIPYAVLISVLIAVTALIPVFGAFIGCIVGALLILMVDPLKALIFIVLFQVLQQLEGNLIYPRVVGGSVGLPSIWVLVAVSTGASLLGIAGMLFFIPLFSVAYALFRQYTQKKLSARQIDPDKYLPKSEKADEPPTAER